MPRTALLPTVAVIIALAGCGEAVPVDPDDPTPPQEEPEPNPTDTPRGQQPASLTYVSGDYQEARTLELVNDLVVRVADERGIRVEGALVTWTVPKGGGRVLDPTTLTDEDGLARTPFRGSWTIGESTVEARVDGVSAPVRFSIFTTTMVIEIWNIGFYVPGQGVDFPAMVPASTPVEFLNKSTESHRVREITRPAGGSEIPNRELTPGERIQFVPDVPGTWEYGCEFHPDETGTILVPG